MHDAAYFEFSQAVDRYYRGLPSLAQWDGAEEFLKLDRSVINRMDIGSYNTIILSVEG